jgi:hypothetical protein
VKAHNHSLIQPHLHVNVAVQLAPIPQVQRHISAVDVMQGDVQLLGNHCQGVAVYACDDAAPKVRNSSNAAVSRLAVAEAAAAAAGAAGETMRL